jgi:protein-tyrosine-phosphatase
MSESGQLLLARSIDAFRGDNVNLARVTKNQAAAREREFHRVFHNLLDEGERASRHIEDLFGFLVVFYRLNRVEDQVKNICEETIFIVTGEVKQPKVYSILFVDERGSRWSPMAAALARKAYPESGDFRCSGWDPADDIDAEIAECLDRQSFDRPVCPPHRFEGTHAQLRDYDVVIGLQPGLLDHVQDLPFHTVLLEWDVVEDPETLDPAALDATLKRMASNLGDLMEVLSGGEAS